MSRSLRVALVGPEIEENLSLRYIASSLAAAGHTAEIVAFNVEADFAYALHTVLQGNFDLVGISLAFQWRASDFLALGVAIREQGFAGHLTVGGHFATFAAREILRDFPELSSVCRQEAELTMVALADAVAAHPDGAQALATALREIPGLALHDGDGQVFFTAMPTPPDLAKLPRPDRRGTPAACFGHGIAPLVASRGCYANCSFCCIAAWHEQTLPGKRYRIREVADVADEMLELQRSRGVDIFVFHDDNFFVPGHKKNRERLSALADALDRLPMTPFATVVKARPTDVDPEVFRILVERLHCIRVYIGVESDADQGLETLRRWSPSKQNHRAIELVRKLDLYTCFNMLLFDPDTTLESILINVDFLKFAPEYPSNFGRVELYAGTPLLERMRAENRARGDYLQWDYSLANPQVERVFDLSMRAFHSRNFGVDALANRIMGTRFDVEVARRFHKDVYRAEWLAEGKALTATLTLDGANALEKIVRFVEADAPTSAEADFVGEIAATLRATEDSVRGRAKALARDLKASIKQGDPLTDLGDRVATPLQTSRSAPSAA